MIEQIVLISLTVLILAALAIGRKYNEIDWGGFWINCIDGWMRLYCRRFHRLESGACQLPATGHALIASNHVSGLDPLLLLSASKRRLRFLMATEEYNRFGLTWLFKAAGCIPVERESKPEKAFRAAIKALNQGEVVAIFPHGKIHLDSEPYRPIKRGVIKLAKLTDCPIIATRIDGIIGEGDVLGAIFKRSHAKVTTAAPLAQTLPEAVLVTEIENVINKKAK